MTYYLVLFTSFFLFAFVLRSFRFAFYSLAENSLEVVDTMVSETNEDDKIELLNKRNKQLLLALLKMLAAIIAAVVVGSIPLLLYSVFSNKGFNTLDFGSVYAILTLSLGATVPFLLPYKKKKSEYSELSQLLHRMALNNYNIANKLFRIEAKKISKENLTLRNDFVIITGLARAGTTSLMNDLAKIDAFVSLNYANMPFLLCPNIWARFYKPKAGKLRERSHKDGIMIGMDSNEALEEYFFKVKANDSYISEDGLSSYQISEEYYRDYLVYQSIIKRNNQKIYIAKNNNFILRYNSVRKLNPDFVMVILYRDPVSQAASLMEKHRDYKKLQEDDPFVLEYMNWLGHHEFGLNQKVFTFSETEESTSGDKETLNYWLKIWINYYKQALTIDDPNTVFINYEDFCSKPEKVVERILEKMKIEATLPQYKAFNNKRTSAATYSAKLFEKAGEIYEQLNKRIQ